METSGRRNKPVIAKHPQRPAADDFIVDSGMVKHSPDGVYSLEDIQTLGRIVGWSKGKSVFTRRRA